MKNISGQASLIKSGNIHFLGIIINDETENKLLSLCGQLYKHIKSEFFHNLLRRNDNHGFHITLVGPFHMNDSLSSKFLIKALTTEITDIELLGVGTVSTNDKQTWFIPVKSKTLQSWSKKFGIDFSNLHITIAFDKEDIHNVDKTNTDILNFEIEEHKSWIGKEVIKKSKKPFKNSSNVDTVKSIGLNPHTNKPAFQLSCDEWVEIRTVQLNN